jgi:hypothetical protein
MKNTFFQILSFSLATPKCAINTRKTGSSKSSCLNDCLLVGYVMIGVCYCMLIFTMNVIFTARILSNLFHHVSILFICSAFLDFITKTALNSDTNVCVK